MKKSLKKLLSMTLVIVLSMSLMACGSKESSSNLDKLSAEDLLNKVVEASKDTKGASGKADFDVQLLMSGQGQEMDMKMAGNMKVEANTDPEQSHMTMDFSYDMLGQSQKLNMEMYQITDGEKAEVYTKQDDEWTYESTDLSEYSDSIAKATEMFKNFDYGKVSEYFDSIECNTSGKKYELVAKMSSKKLMSILEDEDIDLSSLGLDLSTIPAFEVTLTASFDGKTFLPASIKLGVSIDKFELQGVSVELKKFDFAMDFTSYEAVEITVPEEALAAKEAE